MQKSPNRVSPKRNNVLNRLFEALEERRMLASVTLNPDTTYQTIQGWGAAAVYPTNEVTIAQAGTIMRDAGMNVVRVTPSAYDYTYTVGGNMRTPVPISADLDENVARFYPGGNDQTDLINWLEANAYEPDRVKMIGALWSPPHWMKITTGRLMNWDDNGTPRSEYDPIIPWGDYGHNTGGGRVNPTMWTDWARFVLSTVKKYEQETGLPMHAFSFQNEPNVPAIYNSGLFEYIANDVNNPSAGFTSGHWELYGDALQALANERALHPEITTKFFGPELPQLGGGASNPYNLPSYNSVRQNLISRGLLDDLGGWATHEYTYPADSAAMWDAWYNGSAHAAQIINGTNNLGWLGPTPGIAADNKEIWQTESEGEGQSWTKDGAMGYGLKIHNALVLGNASGYTSWNLTGYSANDEWGVVKLGDINNPTNSYKYDAFKHFSRWIRPGAQRINATFGNGKASTGGAHELDTYNGLNVAAFKHTTDQRLTMVFTNMRNAAESTTITIPAGLNVSSFQVYQTSGTQKYVQLANLTPSNGQVTLTVPASSFVTLTGSYSSVPNAAPTVATAAAATPNPATATSVTLSVLGADDAGESNLSYNWSLIGSPPASVTFSANGTNAAKNATATFTQAGTYQFQVIITDAGGLTASSTVNVNVGFGAFTNSVDVGAPATAGSLSYVPATGVYTIKGGGADIWGTSDQFRFGYVSLTGNSTSTARVTSVTNTDFSAKAGIMFRNSTAANASYAYAWIGPNGGAHFETRSSSGGSSNYSANATGGNPVWVRITRSGASNNQFAAYVSTNGTSWTQIGTTQTITMGSTALVGLGVTSHNNSAGVLNTSTFDNVTIGAPPTVATAASATPNPVISTSTVLSVLGADDGGEANLTYTWLATLKPSGSNPLFSANGTNAAKSSTVTFDQAGSYTFQVTISDGSLSTTSSVNVTVNQTLTSITVLPASPSVPQNQTQQFTATAYDQFADALTSQPGFTWSIFSGVGSTNSTGLYSAGSQTGGATVRATSGSINGNASVTVVDTTAPTVVSAQFLWQTSDNKIAIEFSEDVSGSLGPEDLSVMLGANPVTVTGVSYLNNVATFTLAQPIPNGNYTATLLAAGVEDPSNNPLAANYPLAPFFILHGDANQDRKVNTLDFNILAGSFGMSGKVFSEGNFDYDANGTVDSLDFNVFAGAYGVQVPAPAAPAAALFEELTLDEQEEIL